MPQKIILYITELTYKYHGAEASIKAIDNAQLIL